jgi:hypothetical protein
MKICKLGTSLLFLICLFGFNAGCTTVEGTAVNITGGAMDHGAEISVVCDEDSFQDYVQEEGNFAIPVLAIDGSCTFDPLEYPDEYGASHLYECISSNCDFTIAEGAVQEDLSEVMFTWACVAVDDCEEYCITKEECPGDIPCWVCMFLCELSKCD